MYVLKVVGIW